MQLARVQLWSNKGSMLKFYVHWEVFQFCITKASLCCMRLQALYLLAIADIMVSYFIKESLIKCCTDVCTKEYCSLLPAVIVQHHYAANMETNHNILASWRQMYVLERRMQVKCIVPLRVFHKLYICNKYRPRVPLLFIRYYSMHMYLPYVQA